MQAKEKQNEGKTLQQVPQDMKGWQRVERGRAGQEEGAGGLTEELSAALLKFEARLSLKWWT